MLIDHEFVGIKFEWQGTTRTPWERREGLDCVGLTNYYQEKRGIRPLPLSLIGSDGWSRKTMPEAYILSKARTYTHLVSELPCYESSLATMIIYQGYEERMCLAPISLARPETALVFGADLRSHWIEINRLDNVTYWKLN